VKVETRCPPLKEFKLAESARQVFRHAPQPGTPRTRLIEPSYYLSLARYLHIGDVIEIHSEADGYFIEMLVRDCSPHYVAVTPLREVTLPAVHPADETTALPAGHSIEWLGPEQLWAALRGSQVLRSGFPNKGAAISFLGDLARAGAVA
jgi:hypothetical protein